MISFSVEQELINRLFDDSRKKEDRMFSLELLLSNVAYQTSFSRYCIDIKATKDMMVEYEKEKFELHKLNVKIREESRKRLAEALHAQGRLNLKGAIGIT